MRTKILRIQKSAKPIWETKLSIDGIINGKDNIPPTEQAYEMVLSIFEDEDSLAPIKNIVISPEHHENNILKYGMETLLRGVTLVSMLSITEHRDIKHEDTFEKEIEAIAYSIVGRMEQDTFFNNYNPTKMREYIEEKITRLKDKFRIEPK
jgi:hypothetical protein